MKFKRKHIPTGEVQTFTFSDSHHECFGYYNVLPKEKVEAVAAEKVKAWNRQHPDKWQYELVEKEDATQ